MANVFLEAWTTQSVKGRETILAGTKEAAKNSITAEVLVSFPLKSQLPRHEAAEGE